jgi:hypothetical protein
VKTHFTWLPLPYEMCEQGAPWKVLSGEGPSSRRYGRTAAMRLIVQPCDEDEDDDYFLSFS